MKGRLLCYNSSESNPSSSRPCLPRRAVALVSFYKHTRLWSPSHAPSYERANASFTCRLVAQAPAPGHSAPAILPHLWMLSVSEGNNPGQGLNTTTERLAQQTTRPQSRGTSHICGLEDPGRKASITRLGGYMEDLGVCSCNQKLPLKIIINRTLILKAEVIPTSAMLIISQITLLAPNAGPQFLKAATSHLQIREPQRSRAGLYPSLVGSQRSWGGSMTGTQVPQAQDTGEQHDLVGASRSWLCCSHRGTRQLA